MQCQVDVCLVRSAFIAKFSQMMFQRPLQTTQGHLLPGTSQRGRTRLCGAP